MNELINFTKNYYMINATTLAKYYSIYIGKITIMIYY